MISDQIYEEASNWLAHQQDDAMDWDAFTTWLEADPDHRAAFHQLALMNSDLEEKAGQISQVLVADESPAANSPGRPWRRWAGLGGIAIAASIAGLLWLQPGTHEITRDFRAPPGKMVRIAFLDGANIILAPRSELKVRSGQMDLRGSALFDIPHRAERALSITAGEFEVTDIGTRFSIESERDALSVEVARGSVRVRSDRLKGAISLSSGQAFLADHLGGTVQVTSIAPQEVGSWRTGKLEFDNAPLALVAQEISRYSGEEVTVDPGIADRKFSGVITVNHGEAPLQTLAQILSLEVKVVDGANRLGPRLN